MKMLKIVALLITLAAVYSEGAIIDWNPFKSVNKQLEDLGVDTDIVNRCSEFPTVAIPPERSFAKQYLVSTSRKAKVTCLKTNGSIPNLAVFQGEEHIEGLFLYSDNSIVKVDAYRQEVSPGLFYVSYDWSNSFGFLKILDRYFEANLRASNDTVLKLYCTSFQFPPKQDYEILTTTGKITPSVSEFEKYVVHIGAIEEHSIRRIRLNKCEAFYNN
ncbi:hypothetical protein CHUAL_006216 [Chamberlinius hualienensis]